MKPTTGLWSLYIQSECVRHITRLVPCNIMLPKKFKITTFIHRRLIIHSRQQTVLVAIVYTSCRFINKSLKPQYLRMAVHLICRELYVFTSDDHKLPFALAFGVQCGIMLLVDSCDCGSTASLMQFVQTSFFLGSISVVCPPHPAHPLLPQSVAFVHLCVCQGIQECVFVIAFLKVSREVHWSPAATRLDGLIILRGEFCKRRNSICCTSTT